MTKQHLRRLTLLYLLLALILAAGPLIVHADVVEDIACKHNVAAAHPEVVAQLNALADHARRDLGDQGLPGLGQRPVGKVAIASPRRLRAK